MSKPESNVLQFTVTTKMEAIALKPRGIPLSALTKEKASEYLRSLGEEPPVTWTSAEIKSRIKEVLDLLEDEEVNLPKNMSGMKKAELQRACTERNINFTEHTTKGAMMRKIRDQVEAEKVGKAGNLMGFGQHAALTFEEVVENHPAYVKWAVETVQEEGYNTSVGLRKFVNWVINKEKEKETKSHLNRAEQILQTSGLSVEERTIVMKELNPNGVNNLLNLNARSSAAASPGRRGKRTATKDADAMRAEVPLMTENPTPTTNVEAQLLGALEKIDKRLNVIEARENDTKSQSGTASDSWQIASDHGAEASVK